MNIQALASAAGRYLSVGIGPIVAAISQFALSLLFLHGVNSSDFGIAAVLLIFSQFCLAISSALICAPFQVTPRTDEDAIRSFRLVDVALAFASACLCGAMGLALGASAVDAGLFALYSMVIMFRWFARAVAYSRSEPEKTIASDLVLGAATMLCIGAMALTNTVSLTLGFSSLLLCALLSTLAFGPAFLPGKFMALSLTDLRGYKTVWQRYARWSLIGVITTEATVNAHAYLVTMVLGPAAFAPVAAASLLIRPIGLAMNALADFERPRIANFVSGGKGERIKPAIGELALGLLAAWGVSAIAAVAILLFWPGIVVPPSYAMGDYATGTLLWFVVALVRIIRTPASVLMQAMGEFRSLAHATYASSAVSIVAVLVLVFAAGATWSVLGILAGEVIVALMVWRISKRLMSRSLVVHA